MSPDWFAFAVKWDITWDFTLDGDISFEHSEMVEAEMREG